MKNIISILKKVKNRFLLLHTCLHVCIYTCILQTEQIFRFFCSYFSLSVCEYLYHHLAFVFVRCIDYCKSTFIHVRENLREVCVTLVVTNISANQSLAYVCNKNTGMDQALLRKLIVANQFISG